MKKQQGMTLIGMLLTVACVTILGILVIRVVPVYLENYTVNSSVRNLNEMPATELSTDSTMNVLLLKKRLANQLVVNGVDELVKNKIIIKPLSQTKYEVTTKYQVIKPIVYNVSLLFDFEDVHEVTIANN